MDLKFKFNSFNGEKSNLINSISSLKCKINIDFKNNVIVVKNSSKFDFENIFDLIKSQFEVLEFNIDNTDIIDENAIKKSNLEVPFKDYKVDFQNQMLKYTNNKELSVLLTKEISSIIAFSNKFPESDLINRIVESFNKDLDMRLYKKSFIEINIFDVVECVNIIGFRIETSYEFCIVKEIKNALFFAIPIKKCNVLNDDSNSLEVNLGEDIYNNEEELKMNKNNKIIGINEGKYISRKRIIRVIGRLSEDIQKKLLNEVSEFEAEESANNFNKSDLSNVELAIYESIKDKIQNIKIDDSLIINFLKSINISTEPIIVSIFKIAYELDKNSDYSFSKTIAEVEDKHKLRKTVTNLKIREIFNSWIDKSIKDTYPKASIKHLINIFLKYFN